MRFAKPSSQWTSTTYSLPVSRRILCENSDRSETVGKLFNFPLRLAVKRDEEWDCASKSGGFVSIFPTGDMTPDFSHSLDPLLSFELGHSNVRVSRSKSGSIHV